MQRHFGPTIRAGLLHSQNLFLIGATNPSRNLLWPIRKSRLLVERDSGARAPLILLLGSMAIGRISTNGLRELGIHVGVGRMFGIDSRKWRESMSI